MASQAKAQLASLGIKTIDYTHAPVMTVDAQKTEYATGKWKGNLSKNLLIKDKKKNVFLLCAHCDAPTDMKKLVSQIEPAKNSLRFAPAEELETYLNVPQGHVSPLACINDTANKVIVVMDKYLAECSDLVLVHPCTNEETVGMTYAELCKYLAAVGNEVIVADLDWSGPGAASATTAAVSSGSGDDIETKITAQGLIVRDLKTNKASKEEISAAVKVLLALKQQGGGAPAPKKAAKKKEDKPKKPQMKKAAKKNAKKDDGKKETGLAITSTKAGDFSKWFRQVCVKSEMIEYYDISGCYILRPWSYNIWEEITKFFDGEIKKLGVKNTYFPLFVPEDRLTKEAEHVEGFTPEVAWVTRSGKSDLEKPIAIRPTSETVMYPAFANWIKSHRDLPLKINQWCNVIRWEFKCPTPFLRTREFLWQEGHSAFATLAEAEREVLDILELYARVYEELLCVPVIKGKKTENEKFAGGLYTTTVEAFIEANGRAIQGATSHCLGQNFSKMFNITFSEGDTKEKKMVWQNSWGLTTRTIGVMIMTHGDDKGLVLPPRVAPIQVVIVPIFFKEKETLKAKANDLAKQLEDAGLRVHSDIREDVNPGWKFNHWELKGVPLRLELGPKDMEKQCVMMARRDTGEKKSVPWANLQEEVVKTCLLMQRDMLSAARKRMAARMITVDSWVDMNKALNSRNMALSPWCGRQSCEEDIKTRTQEEAQNVDNADPEDEDFAQDAQGEQLTGAAKSLCTPFHQPPLPEGATCVGCGGVAINYTLFGRSY